MRPGSSLASQRAAAPDAWRRQTSTSMQAGDNQILPSRDLLGMLGDHLGGRSHPSSPAERANCARIEPIRVPGDKRLHSTMLWMYTFQSEETEIKY